MNNDILVRIGENIKKNRLSKNITQEELSIECGMHRNYIISIEKGERNISVLTLKRLAAGLNLNIESLLE